MLVAAPLRPRLPRRAMRAALSHGVLARCRAGQPILFILSSKIQIQGPDQDIVSKACEQESEGLGDLGEFSGGVA